MAVIFRSPDLQDYFVERSDVTRSGGFAPIVQDYEAARVLTFPNLRFDIDFEFWSRLESDAYPGLKKLSSSPDPGSGADRKLDARLAEVGLPPDMEQALRAETARLREQVAPVYEALFSGYRFTRRQAVWRLNTVRNENLHLDTYAQDFDEHFARLFINLDSQPRIWMTSYTMEELSRIFGGETVAAGPLTPSEFRLALNREAFGGRTAIWWDRQPRHMVYFDPGDVWAVDSRQVAHQIFYGRRAVSFDFFVDPASMHDPRRHYLAYAEDLMNRPVPA